MINFPFGPPPIRFVIFPPLCEVRANGSAHSWVTQAGFFGIVLVSDVMCRTNAAGSSQLFDTTGRPPGVKAVTKTSKLLHTKEIHQASLGFRHCLRFAIPAGAIRKLLMSTIIFLVPFRNFGHPWWNFDRCWSVDGRAFGEACAAVIPWMGSCPAPPLSLLASRLLPRFLEAGRFRGFFGGKLAGCIFFL